MEAGWQAFGYGRQSAEVGSGQAADYRLVRSIVILGHLAFLLAWARGKGGRFLPRAPAMRAGAHDGVKRGGRPHCARKRQRVGSDKQLILLGSQGLAHRG